MHVSPLRACSGIEQEIYHRCFLSRSPTEFMCVCITHAVHPSVLWSPGAAGARLLSGQNKPVAMDVDEEENMSESNLAFSSFFFCLSSSSLLLHVCLFFYFPPVVFLHALPCVPCPLLKCNQCKHSHRASISRAPSPQIIEYFSIT